MKKYSIQSLEDLKQGLDEALGFILSSMGQIKEEEIQWVKEYILSYIDQLAIQNTFREVEKEDGRKDIDAYEQKIERIKEDIKYLKELKKKKEELGEKEKKRYKVLRKLWKNRQLEGTLEQEYKALRKKYKNHH
jgi:hypothetical protein